MSKFQSVFTAIIFLVLILIKPVLGSPIPLLERLKKEKTISLQVTKTHRFSFDLKDGDYLGLKLSSKAIFTATIKDSNELIIFEYKGQTGDLDLNVSAETPGEYYLDITKEKETQTSSKFVLEFKDHRDLNNRVSMNSADFKTLPPSPFMKKARTLLGTKPNKDNLEKFWAQVSKKGTPIIEDGEANSEMKLVTFLWRGNENTKNVAVEFWPYSYYHLYDYVLEKIPETDIWFKSLLIHKKYKRIYRMLVNVPPRLNNLNEGIAWAGEQYDPLNPRFRKLYPENTSDSKFQKYSLLIMPEATPLPEDRKKSNWPKGQIETLKFESKILKNERLLSVYKPKGYDPKQAYPLVVLFDREDFLNIIPAPDLLDELIHLKKIPPLVAILVASPEPKESQRWLELSCNPQFLSFVAKELVPWARTQFNAGADPRLTTAAGLSLGGLTAFCAGFYHSDEVQRVISLSGSFWWKPKDKKEEEIEEFDYMSKEVINYPKRPLQVYLSARLDEIDLEGRGQMIFTPSQNLKNTLLAKGYPVKWTPYYGGHDYLSWGEQLVAALVYIFK